jgi:nitroimidazol reductase NimA-like FMN-containing flavoprotein (pyridoxamine 5'-phosphate oxidase superfamily)
MNVARVGGTFDSESRATTAHTMNAMSADGSGFEVLSDREAVALLATVPVGRLVYSDRAMPSVVPVVFVFDGVDIIIRTGRRSRLATLAPGNIVAFEVDDIAMASRSGWTVVVTGRVELVDDRAHLERLSALRLQTWLPGPTDCYLRLRPELIAGRRIPTPAAVPA